MVRVGLVMEHGARAPGHGHGARAGEAAPGGYGPAAPARYLTLT